MIVKRVYNSNTGREKLKNGVRILAEAVGSTLGPGGRPVILESENHTEGLTVTKDGVTVANSINLYDPVENMAVMLTRQAARQTAKNAGDGTTTSIVLTHGIIEEFDDLVESNHTQVAREIQRIGDQMCDYIDSVKLKCSDDMVRSIATISTNNDESLGDLISETFSHTNFVTVENSNEPETKTTIIDGIKVDRGYTSRYFITDHKRDEVVLENTLVLLIDAEIEDLFDLKELFEFAMANKKSVLIIGNLSDKAKATLSLNVMNKTVKAANIIPPSIGHRRQDMMSDLAASLGAVYYSESTGDNLASVSIDGLGHASKVTITETSSIIVPSDFSLSKARLLELNDMEMTTQVEERISAICGRLGIISVGAPSQIEQKELRDRVDDAVCAIRAAIEDGIVAGGSKALLNAFNHVESTVSSSVALDVMRKAIMYPLLKMLENAGEEDLDAIAAQIKSAEGNSGMNIKTMKMCKDLIAEGIIDPSKVTKNSIQNAISVATTIINSSSIIVNERADASSK